MSKTRIRIELLSDLCVSDGGVYNSMLDTDICYDDLGLPYIPAKRLKGCLRECAQELQEWGMAGTNPSEMFGDKGDAASKIRIGNAYISQYEEWRTWILKHQGNVIVHPQNVLNHFSYIRTQTAIDYKTGVADDTTLRTIRVANKGLVFYADVDFKLEQKERLEDCCVILSHMGIARTRGFGEVSVRLDNKNDGAGTKQEDEEKSTDFASNDVQKDIGYLQYSLELLEPMICKSVNGEEARTLDYIEGSKTLGVILQKMKECGKENQILDFLNRGELICSNAYLAIAGKRYTEVPASIYSVKNESDICVNKIYEPDKENQPLQIQNRQLNQMKHCYVNMDELGNIKKVNVMIEERYHHRRPDDKSVGRALATENDADFYQMASITQRQTFMGFINGTKEQLKEISQVLKKENIVYMGYARTSEYGAVRLSVGYQNKKEKETATGKEIVLKLNAPTIVYNEHAFYSTNPKDLVYEICSEELGVNLQDVEEERVIYYTKYTTIGGYNVTWKSRKPIISAFDQGTVVYIPLKKECSVQTGCVFIGERVQEGYGEAEIKVVDSQNQSRYLCTVTETDMESKKELPEITFVKTAGKEQLLGKNLCDECFQEFIRFKALDTAKMLQDVNKATVSNMLLMCVEETDFERIKKNVDERFDKAIPEKQEKLKAAKTILKKVEEETGNLKDDFTGQYRISGYWYDENSLKTDFLKNLLKHLKYQIRQREVNTTKGGEYDGGFE